MTESSAKLNNKVVYWSVLETESSSSVIGYSLLGLVVIVELNMHILQRIIQIIDH